MIVDGSDGFSGFQVGDASQMSLFIYIYILYIYIYVHLGPKAVQIVMS